MEEMETNEQPIEIGAARILDLLLNGDVSVEGMLPYSSNYTLLASVEHAGLRALAVYKPRRGERPLWDFARGTLYQREVAAYLTSEALGFSLVPPTVVRDGPYGVGALQFYVHNDEQSHLLTMQQEGHYTTAIMQVALFDCVINNADRKSGHCLKGIDGRIWAIDHGLTFHHEDKLRTVLWDFVGQPLPPDLQRALCAFRESLEKRDSVAQALEELLSRYEMNALCHRLDVLIATNAYPSPGPGPNIPWPPI